MLAQARPRMINHLTSIICVLSPYQMSPLHWAADGGQLNTMKFLVEKGANLNSKDDEYGVSE